MSLQAPGVYVKETVFPTYTVSQPTQTIAVFIGANNRGPTTPVLVQSWAQYVSTYGGFTGTSTPSNLSLAVYEYFNNGGSQCYIIRVTHSDAEKASCFLVDSDTTPDNTIEVLAANPGVWADNLYVNVLLNTGNTSFDLTIYYGGTTSQNVVERWTGLTTSQGDSNYFANVVNNPLAGSAYISLVDLSGTPTVPADLPAAQTVQLGSGNGGVSGADGSAPSSSDYVAVESLLDQIDQPLLINFPGNSDASGVLGPMTNYVTTTRAFQNSILICDPPQGQNTSQVVTFFGDLPPSSYAIDYYPWLVISDPASSASNALRTVAPGAFAMAQMAKQDANSGVWTAPAGLNTALAGVVSPERTFTQSDLATLNNAQINCIRSIAGSGTVIWGARTRSNLQVTLYINVRRLLIYVEAQCRQLTNFAVFANNNWILWNQIASRLSAFLNQLFAAGAFAGDTAATSFFVTCDSTNNTPTTIAAGQVNAQVGVAGNEPAEFVLINVGQWSGGTSVIEVPSTVISAV